MNKRLLGSAACAALIALATPAAAATSPELPSAGSYTQSPVEQAITAFYAHRNGQLLWTGAGPNSNAALALISALQRAPLDGLPSGPVIASQAQGMLNRAQGGDASARFAADRFMSEAWIAYVAALQTPPAGMTYADAWVAPHRDSPATILARAATAPSLVSHVREVSSVNPIYAQLREAAWSTMQASGASDIDSRTLASLDRARDIPPQGRYVIVDTAGARLYMIEDGRIADSMKVIAGKADPATQTPMLASTIYYATLNPYWHVSAELVRSLIARNVLDQGTGYLRSHGYQILSPDGSSEVLDPRNVDWKAVAAGDQTVAVRQLPGPYNSMGQIKIGFANDSDIFLHDTPNKALFAGDDRNLSHGCIRLEDAERLGRWLMAGSANPVSAEAEQQILLPKPVPIYVTYLTAQVKNGQLSFVDDIYGRDAPQALAALR